MYRLTKHNQSGAVSIFIVIFTALLVTIVTTSFVQIMLRNQQQASNNDLSQSAYDSAMAGVEDAKRALVKLKLCSRSPGLPGCPAVRTLINNGNDDCQSLGNELGQAGVVDFVNNEVIVGDAAINQAYTCVKVDVQTESYDGRLDPGEAVVIPLLPVGDSNELTSVRISWYSLDDLPDGQTVPQLPSVVDLPNMLNGANNWGATVPPIMRAQLMQFNSNAAISLDGFDGGNARTRFLYPLAGGGSTDFALDNRRAVGTNQLVPGGCSTSFWYKGFACSVTVSIPAMTAPQQREAYLQLAGHYIRQGGGMTYRVELIGTGGASVDFDNVQPKVDSTGRASDLFRRVRANVTVSPAGTPEPFPEATIITTNLCKDFFITDSAGQYNPDASGGGTCEP